MLEGVVQIKRICGHCSPYTFKKNERFGKQRLEKFLSKKCPACTQAAIQALEARQKADSARLKHQRLTEGATESQVVGVPASTG